MALLGTNLRFDDPGVLTQKLVKEFDGLPAVMPAKSGHPEAFDFPGFRVALATASLPGMTIELCREL
jgi:hypothetical protein